MSKLELILLGRFECLLSTGRRVSLSMRKAEVLLAFLALAPGLRHPRERLINLLWSDRGEEQARNSLRQCLSAIRKSLGEAADMVLQIDRTTVCLNAELIDIDVHEFERLAASGDYESLLTAADLYQGEFLEGITIRDAASQDWLDGERARFKRQFVEILHNLAETQFVSHDYDHAVRSAERLVEQDPLDEAGWRLLMQSHAAAGNRNHALQAFKRCQQTLRRELGVEPEAVTVELRERIAAGTATRPTAAAVPRVSPDTGKQESRDGEHSIAVLPFDNLSGDPEQEYFSDGITESIILNLAHFPGLQVKSRHSSFAFKQQLKGLAEISRELEADYIVEGSVRKARNRIRITTQLIDAASGNQLWGKRYDAEITDLFELEEELSRSIAATVTGRIGSELQRVAIAKGAAGQASYDLLLSGTYYFYRFTREDNAFAIAQFTRCLEQDPDNVRAHAMLYAAHNIDYLNRFTEDFRESFRLSEVHIRKALALGPEYGLVQTFYGEFMVFCGNFDEARRHLDKALAINPNDPDALITLALCLLNQGDFEAALATSERACQLDPYHPWAEWELAASQYLCGQYETALETLANMRTSPGFSQIFGITALVKLGRLEVAREALENFLEECRATMLSMPQTLDQWYEYTRGNYSFDDTSINRDLVDCLQQAGLGDDDSPSAADLPALVVMPFSNLSGDPEQEYFSDGITAGVILSLGLFDGIVVKSQQTSFAFKNSTLSSVEIAERVEADYLVEGSIRKSAQSIRLSVQLIDAASGSQIWGQQYDEQLKDILDLEQELSRALAATISGRLGHRIQQSAARKPAKDLKSYDHLLRGLYHFGKFTAEDLKIARDEIGQCIARDPGNVQAHANLAEAWVVELLENWAEDRELAERKAFEHFETALELDPDSSLAHAYFADFLMIIIGDYDNAEFHVEHALGLNPNSSEGHAVKTDLLSSDGRHEEAIREADITLQLDPYSVGSGWAAGHAYHNAGRYAEAIKILRRIAHPPPTINAYIASCYLGMGLLAEARSEMKRFLQRAEQQMSSLPEDIDAWRKHWRSNTIYRHDGDFEQFFGRLVESGLCDPRA